MLTEDRRTQLDGIVQKMIQNQESENDIQFVVNDFKSKYSQPIKTSDPMIRTGEAPGLENLFKGIAKGGVSTITGLSSFGKGIAENTVGRLVSAATGGGFNKLPEANTAVPEVFTPGTESNKSLTTPEGGFQNTGYGLEKIAEFLAPTGAINKVSGAGQALVKGTGLVAKTARLGIKGATEALGTGAVSTIQQGKVDDTVRTNAIVSGLFSVATPLATQVIGGTANKILGSAGRKIQNVVLKATKSDYADGFDVKNLTKYDLGGSLEDTLSKASIKLNNLSGELNKKLQSSNVAINLNKIYDKTVQDLSGNKFKGFGNNQNIDGVLTHLKNEVIGVAGENGLVSVPEAQLVKQGASTKGSWVFGSADPNATAIEKVYTKFYQNLKTAIEDSSPAGVKAINKQISEIIPIQRAALRRIPVDQRNSAISLTDSIALFGSLFNPKALAILGAGKLAKSGKFGNFLAQAADRLKTYKPSSAIGQRIFGK